MPDESRFLGEWRQIRPIPSPAQILLTFETDGRLTYTIETDSVTRWELRWRSSDTTLITCRPDGTEERTSRYRFRSPAMLVLEQAGEQYVYRRTSEAPSRHER